MLNQKEVQAWQAEIDLADRDALVPLIKQFEQMMEKYHRPRRRRTRVTITTFRQWRSLHELANRRYYALLPGVLRDDAATMGNIMAHAFSEEFKALNAQLAAGLQIPQKFLGVSMGCKYDP